MNIFIPLMLGVLIGYALRTRKRKVEVDVPMSAALLLMIFFMGINAGEVSINAGWLLGSSILFALFTIAGSLGMAVLLGGSR
ncbi:hypothetical protein [Thermococcus sp.]|uniref:hypothetical protein n=1 Tax=Thermococcus sp. TaxID=35749 RepID=UPI0026180A17|nr:hypothetical protein [Thermococcus sp.]